MKKELKLILCFFLSAMLFLSGCGSAKAYDSGAYYSTTIAATDAYNNEGYSFGDYEDEYYYEKKEGEESIEASDSSSSTNFVRQSSEKLVYTCYMEMETLTFESTISNINDLIQKYEGFIEEERKSDSASGWFYEDYRKTSGTLTEYIVIRIPTGHYDEFLRDLEAGDGKITSRNRSVQNITTSYNDTATTIESLKTQEERLLKMMKEAQTVEEMLAIEDRLTEVQNELSIYESRLSGYDLDVAYSTITLNVREVLEYTPVDEPQKVSTFGDRLKNTLKDSWESFTSFLEELLFFLIRALPILAVIGGIVFLIVLAVVKSVRRRKAKRAAISVTASTIQEEEK